MGLAHSPRIVTNGLVLCLDAGNTKSYPGSGTTWTDISRRGNNGTLTNGPTFSSANKGSIVFDGVNDRVDIPNTVDTRFSHTSSWTFSIFFKVIKLGSYPRIFSLGQDVNYGLGMWTESGQNIYVKHNNTQQIVCPANYGTIKNVTLVYPGSGSMLGYENAGSPVTLIALTGTDTTTPLKFAVDLNNVSTHNMNMYCAIKYNRALSAAEIAQNFNALRGRFGI